MEALTRNGLQNTAYGRMVIANAHAATVPRVDNLTTEQRAAARGF